MEFGEELKLPFLKYVEGVDVEKAGVTHRVRLTDTFAEVEDKISEVFQQVEPPHAAEEPDEQVLDLFEVVQDPKTGYCRILRCFSDLAKLEKKKDESSTHEEEPISKQSSIQEINKVEPGAVSHMSTWVLVRDKDLIRRLKDHCCGVGTLPIRLKVKFMGEEVELLTYNTVDLYSLLVKLSQMTGVEM